MLCLDIYGSLKPSISNAVSFHCHLPFSFQCIHFNRSLALDASKIQLRRHRPMATIASPLDAQPPQLSWRQEQARSQSRQRGRFTSDPSLPGNSSSSQLRNANRKKGEPLLQLQKNVADVSNALMCPGEDSDYIPASGTEGPFVKIIQEILKPEYIVASRLLLGIAKGVYLKRMKKRFIPRCAIRRNGLVVKKRAYVFKTVRLPDPEYPDSLNALKRLITRWDRESKSKHGSFENVLGRITPLLNSYNKETLEYDGYPTTDYTQRENAIPVLTPTAPGVVTVRAPTHTADQLYVSRVDAMARNDAEFLLLKSILAEGNLLVLRTAVTKWQRVLMSMREARRFTSLEQAILDYGQMDDRDRREQIEAGLKKLLYCLMEIRKVDGMDLMLHKGYNPPEFEQVTE